MSSDDEKPKTKAEKALELALDIRKFEIELYWKRATYFWAFLALALAGYLTVLDSKDIGGREKSDALLGVSCLGVAFSLAWYFVNRGSKFWQENWEKHVDILEDGINGPLYKTIMKKEEFSWLKPWAPYPFSVSKINQILSFFVALLFILLTASTLIRFHYQTPPLDWLAICILALTGLTVLLLCWKGSTDLRAHPRSRLRLQE